MRGTAALAALLCLGLAGPCHAWGTTGHAIANGMAADVVPAGPLHDLMHGHRAYLASHSSDPDLWRESDKEEGPRHFMDADRYGPPPFLDVPRSEDAAVAKYGSARVNANGTVPWTVQRWFLKLTDDLRSNDTSHALMDAAALGHYAADAHVPFHAVENYDGQLTGQKGIHARFESVQVDRFVKEAALHPSPVRYIDDPCGAAFGWVAESAMLVPKVLDVDQKAHVANPDYGSDGYLNALWAGTGDIVTTRLEEAAGDVASLWYSAWVLAGRPKLDAPAKEISNTYAALHGLPDVAIPAQATVASGMPLSTAAADDPAVKAALDAHALAAAHDLVGKTGSFVGTVSSVYSPGGHNILILDFDPDYSSALTAVVQPANFAKFPDLEQLKGKRVLVNGTFAAHGDATQVELTSPAQLRLIP